MLYLAAKSNAPLTTTTPGWNHSQPHKLTHSLVAADETIAAEQVIPFVKTQTQQDSEAERQTAHRKFTGVYSYPKVEKKKFL